MQEKLNINRNQNFESINLLRGTASTMVALSHIAGILSTMGPISFVLKLFLEVGYLGVDIFFVISGFIITHSMIINDYKWHLFPKFILKRIIRIEPSYILSIIFLLSLSYIVTLSPLYKGVPFEINLKQILYHISYLPTHFGYEWLNLVYWSLEAEFHFYLLIGLIFPIIFHNKTVLIIFLLFCSLLTSITSLQVFFYFSLFGIGIACSAFIHKRISLTELALLILVNCAIASLLQFEFQKLVVGVITACIIIYNADWSKLRILNFLGQISFSLYLLHMPLAVKTIRFFSQILGNKINYEYLFILTFIICLVASYIFYIIIEKPTQLLSKKIKYNS